MRYALRLSLLLLVLCAGRAGAQSVPSPFRYIEPTQSAGAFVGWLVTDRGDLEIGPHSGPILGGRYTIRLSGPLSGEVMAGTIATQRTVQRRASAAGDSVVLEALGETNSLILLADAGLKFHLTGPRTWHGIAPFGVLTGGVLWDALGESDLEGAVEQNQRVDFGPGFAVSIGAGTDWFPTDRLSVRADARDYLWRLGIPEGLTRNQQSQNEWANNLALTLTVSLHF